MPRIVPGNSAWELNWQSQKQISKKFFKKKTFAPGNSAWELYWQSQIYTKQNWQSHRTGNLKSTQKRKKKLLLR